MVFGHHVEINPAGSAWVDITSHVRHDASVNISRGKPGEGQSAPTATASFSLNNTDGRYSPNNPMGTYYPNFNRNTPVRIWTEKSSPFLWIPPHLTELNYAYTADHASLDIAGDIDVRVEVTHVGTSSNDMLIGKYGTTATTRSWRFYRGTDYLRFTWYSDSTTFHSATSSIQIPKAWYGHRRAYRVTLDVDDGAGGCAVTFYTSDSIDGSWTQFGDPYTEASTTALFASTAELTVGSDGYSAVDSFYGIHAAVVMSSIAGTEVANPDFTVQTAGASSFTDDAGKSWTVYNDAEITKRSTRFSGEISSIVPGADISGNDKYVEITASGIDRRLQQGANPLASTLRRALPALDSLIAYWPCEDGSDSSNIASAVAGVSPMIINGTPTYAGYSEFKASDSIPVVGTSRWIGLIPTYTSTGQIQLRFIINFPASGLTNNDVLASIYTTGTLNRADLIWTTSGGMQLIGYTSAGASLGTIGPYAFGAVSKDWRMNVELTQNGADVDVDINAIAPGASAGGQSGTLSTCTVGRCKKIVINPNQNADGISVGHITVCKATGNTLSDLTDELNAWLDESANQRFVRLCDEESIPVRWQTVYGYTAQGMGYQGIDTLLNLLRECETATGGIMSDDRHQLGLMIRSKANMLTLSPSFSLDLSNNILTAQPVPTFDDQLIRNDIEVSRVGGSTARVTDTTSRLSANSPPSGVGTYKDTINVSVSSDNDLLNFGNWLLHLGTYGGPRFATISLNRAKLQVSGNTTLDDAILDLELGDRIDLTNPQEWVSYETIQLLVVGYTEYLSNYEHSFTLNCQPAEPWRAGVYDNALSIYDTDGTELATPVEGYKATFAGAGTRSYDTTDITSDIDIRCKASLNDWTPSARQTLVAKYQPTGNQRSWRFQVISATEGTPGCLRLYWSNNGSAALLATSTAATGISDGAVKWCRVTLDVNNGAAGNDVKFYLSDDGVNWTQLGSTVTQAFTTSIFDSTALYQIGAGDGAALGQPLSGVIYGAQVISGLAGGSSIVPFDPSEWTDGYSGSVTGGAVLSLVTSNAYIAIANTESTYWTTAAGNYPILLRVNDEIISVAGCTGTGASQTFTTCTRAVNGVNKIHDSGDSISLANPVYYG